MGDVIAFPGVPPPPEGCCPVHQLGRFDGQCTCRPEEPEKPTYDHFEFLNEVYDEERQAFEELGALMDPVEFWAAFLLLRQRLDRWSPP